MSAQTLKPLALLATVFVASSLAPKTLAADLCDSLLAETAPRLIATGFQYTEGPTWDAQHQRFVFSDIPANTVYSLKLDGKAEVLLKPSGFANGNAFDSAGNLWSARHDRKVVRTGSDGTAQVEISTYDGKKLNSPNDLVVAKDGAVWFTDPPFGIQGYGPEKADEEQTARGIYRVKDGKVERMSGDLKLPNGLAFSRDQKSLYVGDTSDGTVYRFKLARDGKLTEKTAFAKVEPAAGKTQMVDGIRIDQKGNLWATGPESIGVFNAKGSLLCRIDMPGAHVSNLAFGGKDGKDLLITYSDRIMALRTKVAGN